MNFLEFAINMELEGEKYYTEQANKNKGNSLHTIFSLLAKDEKKHAEILKSKANKLPYELVADEAFNEYKNVFKEIEDFKIEANDVPDQLDAYKLAIEKEKESIDLYKKMLCEATDDEGKRIFKYLIEQEEAHYKIFDEIIAHIVRVKEWVESAEFGLREKY